MGTLFSKIPFTFWLLVLAAVLIGPSFGFGVFFILVAGYLLLFKGLLVGILFTVALAFFWQDFQTLEGGMMSLLVFALIVWIGVKAFSRS